MVIDIIFTKYMIVYDYITKQKFVFMFVSNFLNIYMKLYFI